MLPENIFKKVCVLVVFLMSVNLSCARLILEASLATFLGTLEKYENTRNDVVFLLDESGSIGVDKFPEVKLFTRLIAQRLSVSAEYSRIAVVTFATETITHIDYIKNPDGNNMCTLLPQIDDIGYVGEWTHTDKAMKTAEHILNLARPHSNKIIVLLTDGQSNAGHSPLQISNALKSRGIIIFAVGVADVNEKEIEDVATSKNHTYILRNFDYISQINKKLVEDIKEASMDLAKNPSYCNNRCDVNAECYCGAKTGKYECVCNAGYFGTSGFQGQCHMCSKGTYKDKSENSNCISCPGYATTQKEGSTSLNDCKCHPGYEKIGNVCSPVRCASLSPPEGGILIPTYCNNTYGSQCSFRCREGYCPFSCSTYYNIRSNIDHSLLPSRTCLETRKWSNEEFYCERISCPALRFPQNGMHNCSENDFTHGTTCLFTCDKGHEISGSESRTCLFGSWTGQEATCKEKYCENLKTNARLHVKPPRCSTQPMPYRSVCVYSCAEGYALVLDGNKTNGILKCGADRKWSGGPNKMSCEDIEKPTIKCPESDTFTADPHKGLALVHWNKPNATDNVHVQDVRMIEPKGLKKPYVFPIGETKVVYEAIDSSKLSRTCSFLVKVLDKEPPKLVLCPPDIEEYHDKNTPKPVQWHGPIFEDNSGNVTVTSNRKSGETFAWGPPSVVYFNATDPSGNTASCSFTVRIKPYPCPYYNPPANGVMTCDNWNEGRICSIFCHEGFDFAAGKNYTGVYYCKTGRGGKAAAKWVPFSPIRDFKVPWPDCARKQPPAALNTSVGVSYSVDVCSNKVIEEMRKKFFDLAKTLPSVLCPLNKGCSPENVKVTCNVLTSRRKRRSYSDAYFMHQESVTSYRHKRHRMMRETPKNILTINFDIMIYPNKTDGNLAVMSSDEPSNDNEINISSIPVIKELENRISLQVKDIYNISSVPEPKVNYGVIVMCAVGQISVNNSCINCPAGTYKDDVSETCIVCPQATYQDEERQLSCKACPVGYTTYEVKSKSRNDCKAPCQPGTYSKTTFEPCLSCPLNTYQERSARKECMKCPSGKYTWRVGANSSSDCVAPCKPGSFSDTGYEPCTLCDIGSYQDKEQQKSCSDCPYQTSTTAKGSRSVEDCKEIDVCNELRPCQYSSTCVQLDKDYECICPDGLMGKNCEINFDDCASGPCLNNGTCTDGIGNFSCSCLDGWTGHQCEINQDDCVSNPCLNDGECIDKVNAYECECASGFTGDRCEKNIYECESNPCHNNGTCFDKKNGYRCCCPKGYFGLNCEDKLNTSICDSVSCHNGGSCFADSDNFVCICVPGFEGEFCETNIDDCKEFQCDNGGICVDGIGNATCVCPPKFTGPYCEKALTPEFLLSFPTPNPSNYARVDNKYRLHAITVAFFMRTSFKDSNSRATPLSYSYKYRDHLVDNALTFLDTNNFVLYIHGHAFHTEYVANSDTEWHHYCVTWEKMNGRWLFYADGNVVASGNIGADKYMHPGTFILGQEQDDIGGRFSTLEAFAGDITEFNVWDYALTKEEIKTISSACGYVGNVIPWYIVSESVYGDVAVSQDVDKCKTLGSCPENSCDCFYSLETTEYTCKYDVKECIDENTCANGQLCMTNGLRSFCNCSAGFEGRRCEYDIDECLEKNGGCSYFCVNDLGTGSYHCECPEDMFLAEDGKTCKDKSYCLKDDKTYMNGEVWVNSCQNCTCNHGIIQCKDIICSEIACHPEETMITSPGECCSKCVAWAFCLISPNNTITSFDMSMYDIEGECTYTAVEDCIDGRFKVQIEPSQNATDDTNIIIYQDCYKILVSSSGNVSVDGTIIELPFENEEFSVEKFYSVITVKTSSDLLIQWNLTEEAVITIPITDVNRMCGICSKIEEYYIYGTGKFPLSGRTALEENQCFIISEGYEEILPTSGAFTLFSSERIVSVLLIVAFMCFLI